MGEERRRTKGAQSRQTKDTAQKFSLQQGRRRIGITKSPLIYIERKETPRGRKE